MTALDALRAFLAAHESRPDDARLADSLESVGLTWGDLRALADELDTARELRDLRGALTQLYAKAGSAVKQTGDPDLWRAYQRAGVTLGAGS